jgi:hypothetical protein
MRHSTIALAAAGLLVSSNSTFAAGLKDGSFEKPHVAAGAAQSFAPGGKIGPWKVGGAAAVSVIGADYSVDGMPLEAKSGSQLLNLGGAGEVHQDLKLVAGTHYMVWFSLGTINDKTHGYGPNSAATVSVDGKVMGTYTTFGQGKPDAVKWTKFGFGFVAGEGTMRLTIKGADGDAFCGIDKVSLQVDTAP